MNKQPNKVRRLYCTGCYRAFAKGTTEGHCVRCGKSMRWGMIHKDSPMFNNIKAEHLQPTPNHVKG